MNGRIFMKFDLSILRKILREKFKISLKYKKNYRNLTSRPIHLFLIVSRSILLIVRNVLDRSCRGTQKHIFYVQ